MATQLSAFFSLVKARAHATNMLVHTLPTCSAGAFRNVGKRHFLMWAVVVVAGVSTVILPKVSPFRGLFPSHHPTLLCRAECLREIRRSDQRGSWPWSSCWACSTIRAQRMTDMTQTGGAGGATVNSTMVHIVI